MLGIRKGINKKITEIRIKFSSEALYVSWAIRGIAG